MSSTNKTATIELSQYIGTDKPTYLVDYNGDMLKIDNAIAADRDSISTAQNKADTADGKADANAQSIQTLDSEVNGAGTGIAARLTNAEGAINTINSLIGDGTPTTTNKTLIGAINELHADIGVVTVKTLEANGTSIEFDVPVLGNNLISFFAEDGADYTAIDTSVAGKVTLTYEATAADRAISMQIVAVPGV